MTILHGTKADGTIAPVGVSAAGGLRVGNGFEGGTYYGDTSSHTGTWSMIQVLSDTKFNVLTGTLSGVANATQGSAPTIPAGVVLYGAFTVLQMHSGNVIAYA